MAAEQLNINTRVKVRGQAIYGIVVNPLPNSDGKILFLDEETGLPSRMHHTKLEKVNFDRGT